MTRSPLPRTAFSTSGNFGAGGVPASGTLERSTSAPETLPSFQGVTSRT